MRNIDDIIADANRVDFAPPWSDMTKETLDIGVSKGWINPNLYSIEEFEVNGVQWVRLERCSYVDSE